MPRAGVALALAASLIGSAACGPSARRGRESNLHPTLSLTSHIEEGRLVALVVSTRAAALREAESYIPIELAVVNKGLESLTVRREGLTLVDEEGRRYAVASPGEIAARYGHVDVDRRLADLEPILASRYISYTRTPSNLTPSFRRPIDRDPTRLPRFSWTVDVVYFPRPAGGVRGRRFELFLDAPELPEPVFVTFRVR